ncbi:MAG: ABC transporter ATP-binding protein [bacterium]
MLQLNDLSKRFSSVIAVQDLSLKVGKGKIFVLLGPNGAGKTTAIKMITGLYQPTSGEVIVDGINLKQEPEKAKAIIGYIPDDPYVYEKLSGREFLYFVGKLYSLSDAVIHEQLAKLLELYPVADLLDHSFASYSRGTKQKFSIIAALLHNPSLLVVDEPIVGLDPQSAQTTKQVFSDFRSRGGTIFLSTHTLSFAEVIADHIGILVKGKLIEVGTLAELREKAHQENASLEKLFLRMTGENTE